jgi:hypothetical protein
MADVRQRHGATDGFPAAVISRAIIHIDGAPGAGKTAFVERLLGALDESVLAVRCRRDESLRHARESWSARDPEVRRYRAAGAPDAGRFTFPSDRDAADDFFTTRLLTDVSDAVVIEGDSPLRDTDLRVFVAPPPAAGQALLVRERRDRAAQQRAQADAMERLLGEPDGAARLLDQLVGGPLVAFAREQPELLEQARVSLLAGIAAKSAPLRRRRRRSAGRSLPAMRGSSTRSWSCSTRVRMRSGGVRRGCWRTCGGCVPTGRCSTTCWAGVARGCRSPRLWPIWPTRGMPGRARQWPG